MIIVNKEACIGCGSCFRDCVCYYFEMKDGKAEIRNPSAACIRCGHCTAVCPVQAITLQAEGYGNEAEAAKEPEITPEALLTAIRNRRSIRQYKKDKVEDFILEDILQAARYTATGSNAQAFTFAVIQDGMEEFKQLAWKHFEEMIASYPEGSPARNSGITQRALLPKSDPMQDTLFWNAPCLVIIAKKAGGSAWDAGMACQNMELIASTYGLGVLYSGYLTGIINQNQDLKDWIGLNDLEVKTCMLMGLPDVKYYRTVDRKEIKVIMK